MIMTNEQLTRKCFIPQIRLEIEIENNGMTSIIKYFIIKIHYYNYYSCRGSYLIITFIFRLLKQVTSF